METEQNDGKNSTTKTLPDKGYEEGKQGPYPKSVFFIISNEFCERFSYYGMRTVLSIYLSKILLYSDSDTISIYHAFAMACYFTPIFGAIIADSWLGKFKTIFYISIIYVLGSSVLSVGAFLSDLSTQTTLSLLGLGLIAIGTGGIKPCVAAFGGDQFVKGQEVYLQQFFSVFYMCINAGSVFSTAITPYLRNSHCRGKDSCFSLAFGVPAALMLVSLVVFLMGKRFYKMTPPGENVIVKLGGCISRAVTNRFSSSASTSKKTHWLDYADDKYDQKFIEEVKSVCRVMVLYLPVPFFWALFDQQGSSWTLQATRMKWSIWGIKLLPDQVQLLNPLFILLLAPLFGYIIYPLLNKMGLLKKPLQKMVVGGLLAGGSFIVCMFVQLAVEAQDSNAMMLLNTVPCKLNITYQLDNKDEWVTLDHNKFHHWRRPYPASLEIESLCESSSFSTYVYETGHSHKDPRGKAVTFVGNNLTVDNLSELEKGDEADVKIFLDDFSKNVTLYLEDGANAVKVAYTVTNITGRQYFRAGVNPGPGQKFVVRYNKESQCEPQSLDVGRGYTYILSNGSCEFNLTQTSPSLSLIWQAPQYILITAGEVMFSVTGLEFSYSQAPKSMKSVLQAGWLLTVAFGNLLVVVIEKVGFERQSTEFLVFGLGMVVDMMLFAVMAYFYRPVPETIESVESSSDSKEMSELYENETEKM